MQWWKGNSFFGNKWVEGERKFAFKYGAFEGKIASLELIRFAVNFLPLHIPYGFPTS